MSLALAWRKEQWLDGDKRREALASARCTVQKWSPDRDLGELFSRT